MLVALAAALSPFIYLPFVRSWLWGSILVVVAVMLTCFAALWGSNGTITRWIRKTLIPQAERRQIDLDLFLSALGAVDKKDKSFDEATREMAGNADDIKELLNKERARQELKMEPVKPELVKKEQVKKEPMERNRFNSEYDRKPKY